MSRVPECDDCQKEVPAGRRRTRCHHCGLFVCGWCRHHVHACEPGHSPADCYDLDYLPRLHPAERQAYLDRLRGASLSAIEAGQEAHGTHTCDIL